MTTTKDKAAFTAAKVHHAAKQLRQAYIDREDAIRVTELAIVAGEHAIMLGPPGTAKSAIIRSMADILGVSFFRLLLNPDTRRDDLVGPINPQALAEGRWDRAWVGLATNQLVFLDEIGKASSQVINMTLDAMEERRVTSAGEDRDIPLISLFSATNETLDDDVEAAWDRFTLRVDCSYLSRAGDFAQLLASRQDQITRIDISPEELVQCRAACREMAANPSESVIEAMVRLWSGLPNITSERVSDRRWKRLLVVAAANALLDNRTEIEPPDLVVGIYMLWQRIDEIDTVQTFVMDEVNVEHAEWKAAAQLTQEISELAARAATLEEKARATYQAEQLLRNIGERDGIEDWDSIRTRLHDIQEAMLA